MQRHLLHRISGTSIRAERDPDAALDRVLVPEVAAAGPVETCVGCSVCFLVPAAHAAARAGDLPRARRYLDLAGQVVPMLWADGAWHAAVHEARGWLAHSEGRNHDATEAWAAAAAGFSSAGQPRDAARCRALPQPNG